jgi:hypothetical protein
MVKFISVLITFLVSITAAIGAERGCFLKSTNATYPHDSRFCVKITGTNDGKFFICKDGTWQLFSPKMQLADPRCNLSNIEIQSADPS